MVIHSRLFYFLNFYIFELITGDTSSGEDCDNPVYPFFIVTRILSRGFFLVAPFLFAFSKTKNYISSAVRFRSS